jgi:hypothetical protein
MAHSQAGASLGPSPASGPVTVPPGGQWRAALTLTPSSMAKALRDAVRLDIGGLEYVALRHPSGASATVFLFGANVTSFVDAEGFEWLTVRRSLRGICDPNGFRWRRIQKV